MIDPKTAWLIAKTISTLLALLIKCASLIGVIYFAVFTASFFVPFFTTTPNANNYTLAHEAKLVYVCCFIVIGFLILLIGAQLVSMLLSLVPGNACFNHTCMPEALWFRISYIVVVALLLSAVLFGTLYPLLKALAWRAVFVAAGRADLEEQAMALVIFMGITLAVGMLSLLRLSWGLVVNCCKASRHCCGKATKGGGEANNGVPLIDISSRSLGRMV